MSKTIGKIIRKIDIYLPGGQDRLIRYFRKQGMKIGSGLRLFDAPSIVIDQTRPWLIRIGDNVRITHGVVILTHDYSKSVLDQKYGIMIGEGAETVIGNNCFIGTNAVILMGSRIGDNVIVGAGSVVSGVIPDNVVVAGNPAKVIRSLDEHLAVRKKRTCREAMDVAVSYYNSYGKLPSRAEMIAFEPLFNGRSEEDPTGWNTYEEFLAEIELQLAGNEEINS